MHREMRNCTWAFSLVADISEGAWTGLTCPCQLCGREKLLTGFESTPVCTKPFTVRCLPVLTPIEMRTR